MKVVANILIAFGLNTALATAQVPRLQNPPGPRVENDGVELFLEGVIVTTSSADSIALVRRAGGRRARALRVGQEYSGYVLVEVRRDSAFLEGPDGGLRIALAGATPPPPVRAPKPELSWERRSFSRAEASPRIEKEMPVILSDTEVTPRVVEGEVAGLELLRLPDGTVLSQSGLLPGDVVRSINEQPLRGVDSLWSLLARFVDDDELRLVVERRGQVVRFAYDFTN